MTSPDLGHLTVVGLVQNLFPGFFHEGIEVSFALCFLIGAAPADNGQIASVAVFRHADTCDQADSNDHHCEFEHRNS
jgi:hypothetical protein